MKSTKLKNQYTINVNDDIKELIEKIAQYHDRKPCELLRLLLIPQLHNEYAKMMTSMYAQNKEPMTEAVFKI